MVRRSCSLVVAEGVSMVARLFVTGHVLLVWSSTATADGSPQNRENDAFPNAVSPRPVFQVTNLKVTNLDSTQAEVKWLKPPGPVSGYFVVICAVKPLRCQQEHQNETYLNLHQLKPNTTYQVRVAPFHHSKTDISHGPEAAISFTTLSPPRLEDMEVHPLNSTSVEVKWKAVSGTSIIIHICPVPSSVEKCRIYHTGSYRSELRIDNLEPGTSYTVVATFSTTAGGHTHPGLHVSRNVTTHPLDRGKNAGSSPVFSGLLMVSTLLYVMIK